ncbi:TIGR01212 family radical SAM protein [Alkaliphilus transvaalensis]|uniref:TIGR01212 family radical SAM protein n=1 Tax=Alkaliphilus transvaalensis TaxID=114628 RepID=UPI001A9A63A8|nr:TIGR01212 family radical SAM protein [Alkaliphilus transvaalensis]
MENKLPYRAYSEYLKEKYNEKVYKLPVNLPVTCPNRDGKVGRGGCTFCGEVGTGFETLSNEISPKEQLEKNMEYIRRRYKANKFIAYFQNYSNTYLRVEEFEAYLRESIIEDIVELCISTRPDCISKEHLTVLDQIKKEFNVEISIELGLQTVNYHSLKKINRGHTLAEFISAVLEIKKYGFEVCTHLILNLPYDNQDDVIENAKILSALQVDQVKLHALYLMEDTAMGKMYQNKEFQLIPVEEYQERVITFLEYLDPKMVVQRLIGRAPEENALFVNWNMSWWKIRDEIHEKMWERGTFQGKKYHYLHGKAFK